MPLDAINPMPASRTGQNYAPAEPLRHANDAMRVGGYSSLSSYFREVCQEIENQDELEWRNHLAMGEVIAVLRDGKRIVKRDLEGDGYVFLKPAPQHGLQDRSNYPIFPSIAEELKAKWEKARPQVVSRAYGDGYKTQIIQHEIDRFIAAYFEKIFTTVYELNEALSAQDFGTYITHLYYDHKLNQMMDLMPIIEDSNQAVHPGYGGCLACPYEGVADDFRKTGAPLPQCPECGSFNTTKMIDPIMAAVKNVVGAEPVVQGDIAGRAMKVPASKFDLRVMAHESSYFRYEQYIPLRLAQLTFGDLNYQTESGSADNFGLDIIEALATRTDPSYEGSGDLISHSPTQLGQRVVFREYWLEPEWYSDFKTDQPEVTVGGTIPANVPYGELFPDGLCIAGFNDMNLITGFYAEKRRIVSGCYYVMSYSGLGKGLNDGVDIAKDLNEMHTMAMADIKRHAASGVVVDKGLGLTKSQVSQMFRPEGVVFANVKKQGFANVGEAVTKLQFQSVNEALPMAMVQLANLLNIVSLSGDFSQGTLQQVDINTLGGQELATAKEDGKKGAIVAMKTFHRELCAESICDLGRTHIKIPIYYPGPTDKQGPTKGRWISGKNFPENIQFNAVPDSAIVQTRYERQRANREFMKEAGGIVAVAQTAEAYPEMTSFFAEQFGTKLPNFDQEEIWVVCLARLENIRELADMFQDPAEIMSVMTKPLFQDETAHVLKANFLAETLDDDEIVSWPPAARGALQLLIKTHRDLARAQQLENEMREQNAQFALAGREQQASQGMMAPMQEQQAGQQLGEQIGGVAAQLGQSLVDDESKGVDHDRQMEREGAQSDRQMQLERLKQQGQRDAAAQAAQQPPTTK